MLRQIHIDKIDEKVRHYQRLYIAVLHIVDTEQRPDQEGKYQLLVTAVFVM